MIPGWVYPSALAVCLALGFGAGVKYEGYRLTSAAEEKRADDADSKNAALWMATAERAEQSRLWEDQRANLLKDLDDKKRANSELATLVANGSRGLFVNATCPAHSVVPAPGTTPGGVPGFTAQLAPSVGPDYQALTDNIDLTESLLRRCVARLTQLSAQ